MAIDSIGPGFNPHLLSDQSPVNAAISSLVLPSSFRPVPDPKTADRVAVGARHDAAGVGRGDQREPVHRHLQDQARGVMDGQRPDRRRRLLVPVAADGQPARRRRPRGLRPDHRRAVGRGRQDGRGDVLAAVSGVARAVQQHPARPHRQGRARAVSPRAWRGRCRSPAVSSGWRASTLSATRSCWPATTASGARPPSPTWCCSVAAATRPHWPTRSATATPRWPRSTAVRPPSPNCRRFPMCVPRGSSHPASCRCRCGPNSRHSRIPKCARRSSACSTSTCWPRWAPVTTTR